MMVTAGKWIESEYITIDEDGWHCDENAPEDIKEAFEEYMKLVNAGPQLED